MIKKKPANTKSFQYYNANPADRRASDCVVRAISYAMGISWVDTFDGLCAIARRMYGSPTEKDVYSVFLENKGWVKKPRPVIQKAKTRKYYTGIAFTKLLQKNHIDFPMVIHIGSHHLSCIKNGKIYDTWDSSDGCLGNIWVPSEYSDAYDLFIKSQN